MEYKSKMYVWKDTEVGTGSKWGGTICAIGADADDTRLNIVKHFLESMVGEPTEHFMQEWKGLLHDLQKEPEVLESFIAFGGDY